MRLVSRKVRKGEGASAVIIDLERLDREEAPEKRFLSNRRRSDR